MSKVPARRVVVATPHNRYDTIEQALAHRGHIVERIRDREELTADRLEAIDPDWVLFPHWSYRIPASVHRRFRSVIFHMTDVPYGRGGSPLQNLVARGHTDTMMTAMKCVDQMDAGAVYLKRPLALCGTAEEIFLRAAQLMADMSIELVEIEPTPVDQVGEVVEFRRHRPADSGISGSESLDEVHDLIRMLDAEGYPNAFIKLGGLRFEFTRSSRRPGAVIADVRITVEPDL